MSVALKEIIRQPGRYLPVWFALTLLVVLLVILAGFRDGLSLSQTGPYRAYDGDVFVFDDKAELQLGRSQVDGDALDDVKGVADVAEVGTLDSTFAVATIDSGGDDPDDDLKDIVLFGYSLGTNRLPDPPSDGTAVVDKQLQRETGIQTGDTIQIGPSAEEVTVGEIVDDLTNQAPTVWVNPDEWRRLAATINPAAVPPDNTHQALVAVPTEGTSASDLVSSIGDVGGLEGATVDETIGALSVVQQQNNSFTGIIMVTFIVSLIVVGLFFALLTLEQTRMYAVMKALGARTGELLTGIGIQAIVVTIAALVVGIALSAIIAAFIPPNLPLRVLPIRVAQIAIGLLITGALGGFLTARRILRIDPATAIG